MKKQKPGPAARSLHSSCAYQLLDEPLVSVEDDSGHLTRLTLPGVLARLSRGEPTEFAALQAHQRHPWHAFLVQLAAIALVRSGDDGLPKAEVKWRVLLSAAAAAEGADDDAFALIVPNLKKAAFMQPPIPSGRSDELKAEHTLPGAELDVLITSKNHDVKMDRLAHPTPEHWVYALVTLQTTQGFLGAGNYGIARMNGGFASRPGVAYAPSPDPAMRFRRDVSVLLGSRDQLLDAYPGARKKNGTALVWCVPWDGTKALPLTSLDPFFIEVCRRIRLLSDTDGAITARRGSSKVARIDGKAAKGNTGDAWTPVDRKDGDSLTVSENGFTYALLQDLLLGDRWKHGAAGVLQKSDGEHPWFVAQVLVRGQGKTGGYHERCLPVPPPVRRMLLSSEERPRLARRAKGWVDLSGTVRLKVLKPALLALVQGGPDKLKFDDDRVTPLLQAFESEVDSSFFQELFVHAGEPDESADAAWMKLLHQLAKMRLEQAYTSVPQPSARRMRGIASAENTFRGTAFKHLPLLFAPRASTDRPLQGGIP